MSKRRERELLRMNRLLVRQEMIAERDVAAVIKATAETVASRLTYGDEGATLQLVDRHLPDMAKALEKNLRQTVLIFGGRTLERIATNLPKSYYAGLPVGTGPVRGDASDLMELKDAREVFEATALQWVKRHALQRATSVMGTIKEAVRRVLVESFADGTGEAGTAKAIREAIGNRLSATNAARIARTEMHTASTIGSDAAARSTGLQIIKEWASAEDARVRRSHAAADGQEVPLDDAFKVGNSTLMVPGDPNGPAREIINCRCAVLHHPVIGGLVIRDDGAPSAPRTPEPPAALSTFNEAAADQEARDYVLKNGRRNGVEFLTGFDAATGRAFKPMRGGVDYCELSKDMIAAVDDPNAQTVLHHNHPSSSAFSPADLGFLARAGLKAILAHGHDGSLYRAEKGELPITKAAIQAQFDRSHTALQYALTAGKLAHEDAVLLWAHLASLALHKAKKMVYTHQLSRARQDAVDRNPEVIARFLDGVS